MLLAKKVHKIHATIYYKMLNAVAIHKCTAFSSNSERITSRAPPMTRLKVNFPPGTSGWSFGDCEASEYLSDQDMAAGRTPKSKRTVKDKSQLKINK